MMITRELWLNEAVNSLWPLLIKGGAERKPTHVSVGFPSSGGLSAKQRTLGECWKADCSADGAAQIFIHPGMHDATEVLAVLAHELIHAAKPEAKHGREFGRVARAIGLEGKLTATVAGEELKAKLAKLADQLGAYPQPKFDPTASGRKKQSTRMLKVVCGCGYTVRTTAKWLAIGVPTCPCGSVMSAPEITEESEEV